MRSALVRTQSNQVTQQAISHLFPLGQQEDVEVPQNQSETDEWEIQPIECEVMDVLVPRTTQECQSQSVDDSIDDNIVKT